MTVWIGFLLFVFFVAARPRSASTRAPHLLFLGGLSLVVSALLYSFKYI